MKCPACGSPMEKILQPSESPLNRDQWDAVRCGDWYCDFCRVYYWMTLVVSDRKSDHSLRRDSIHTYTERTIQ